DTPFVRPETLRRLLAQHLEAKAQVSALTVIADDPMGFGRIVRNEMGEITGVVEEAVATLEQLRIKELNCGIYCFEAAWLWQNLPLVPLQPKGEYYLTDTIELAASQGARLSSFALDDLAEVIGINDMLLLARADKVVRDQIR